MNPHRSTRRDATATKRHEHQKEKWQRNWTLQDYSPAWLGRETSPEIVAAVEEGWFPAGGPALDIGCGEGDVAAWLAARGFPSVGIDIAAAAVQRARDRHAEIPGRLEFHAVDICSETPPDRRYCALIDRGCLHQIPAADHAAFARNILAASAPDARLLLFMRAFRKGIPMGDPSESRRVLTLVEDALGQTFTILKTSVAWIDPFSGQDPRRALPGMVFWMERRHPRSDS